MITSNKSKNFDLREIVTISSILVGVGIMVGQFYYIRDSAVTKTELKLVVSQNNLKIQKQIAEFKESVNDKLNKIIRLSRNGRKW